MTMAGPMRDTMLATSPTDCRKLRRLPPALLLPRLRLLPADAALPELSDGPAELLNRLVERKSLAEAARLIAYALPPREAVWWACMCVAHTAPTQLAEPERAALDAAEAWVRRPDAASRRDAAWAAAAAGYQAPSAWPALAAYWSRLALPEDMRGGRGVETAIDRALQRPNAVTPVPAEHEMARLASFILSGRDIANGGAGRLAEAAG